MSNNDNIIIRLQEVEKVYSTKEIETVALNNINLEVKRGEFISIMGPSGCGKSTLLNIMGLLDSVTEGVISINDLDLSSYSDAALSKFRNSHIGFIFQSFHLINDLPILENVEMPILYRKGVSGKERRKLAKEALEVVGLSARLKHYPNQLSGGQRQRVAIARAIVGSPDIILADEPTGNLDSKMGIEIMDLLKRLNQERETTIIMVTHDEELAKSSDRVIRLFDGSRVS